MKRRQRLPFAVEILPDVRDERMRPPYFERGGSRRDPPERSMRQLILTLLGSTSEALPTNVIVRLM